MHYVKSRMHIHKQTKKKAKDMELFELRTLIHLQPSHRITKHVLSGNKPNKSALLYSWRFSASVARNLFPAPSHIVAYRSKAGLQRVLVKSHSAGTAGLSRPKLLPDEGLMKNKDFLFRNVSLNTSSPAVDFGVCTCNARPTVERFHTQNAN